MAVAAKPQTPQDQPPDERFWVKYSPNHELPVSGAASLLWHVGALVAIVVLGFVVAWGRTNDMPIESVLVDGPLGGGGTGGTGSGPGAGPAALVDATTPRELPPDAVLPKSPLTDIKDLPITATDILKDLATDAETTRDVSELIKVGTQSLDKISKLDKRLRDSLAVGGSPGSGGGSGGGTGTGTGTGDGPGNGTMNQRTKRKLRWTIMFNVGSGHDYLQQLDVLGAILLFQGSDGNLRMVRNLSKHPVAVEKVTEDEPRKLNRISWIDDERSSVEGLMRAMGRDETPPQVVALFPHSFESELLNKELKYKNRNEDSIVETRFQILMRGGRRYDIVVMDQRYR